MTGVTDVIKNARQMYYWASLSWSYLFRRIWLSILPEFLVERFGLADLTALSEEAGYDPIGRIPMPRLEYFREKERMENPVPTFAQNNVHPGSQNMTWGILFPICCRGENADVCWQRVKTFVTSLAKTAHEDAPDFRIIVGIDAYDILYDNEDAHNRIRDEFMTALPLMTAEAIHFIRLTSRFRGKLCHIWNELAKHACRAECDFFVLVGDDITFETANWKAQIEGEFQKICAERTANGTYTVPYGFGCVCFRDSAFEVFPTFPVIHRVHMEIFDGELFPPEFVNQHGDPYLFELYRRWGASVFASDATLTNSVGGPNASRYDKEGVRWAQDILSKSIDRVARFLLLVPTHACWNVVVPSYRCSITTLERMSKLRMKICASSVHILFVIDNPDEFHKNGPLSAKLRQLQDWSPNHLVRIWVQPKNMGASLSRNTGMAQSFGDWCVLLDDDVLVLKEDLLDRYYSSTLQFPHAKILVGDTKLGCPNTLFEKALIASQICYFFGIAQKCRYPPWGVTANLCVQGRMNEVWFSDVYPKSGGGEDVDFCLRTKYTTGISSYQQQRVIVSCPGAAVEHPLWNNISSQAIGWAQGDTLCLSQLPHSTFYALPNWVEWIFFYVVGNLVVSWSPLFGAAPLTTCCAGSQMTQLCTAMASIIIVECTMSYLTVLPNVKQHYGASEPTAMQALIALFAMVPSLCQDVTRLYVKLCRGQFYQLCMHFNWMDGTNDYMLGVRSALFVRFWLFLLILKAVGSDKPFMAALYVAISLIIMFLWYHSTVWNEGFHRRTYLDNLGPLLPTNANTNTNANANDRLATLGQSFVVLAHQRTGSNYLCGRLHNHPDFLMHSELFNEEKIYMYLAKGQQLSSTWKSEWDIFRRNQNPHKFLIDIFTKLPFEKLSNFKNPNPSAVGFKLFPEHWKGDMDLLFRRMLADPTIKKVILRRNNLLELYASKVKADRTGRYIGASLDGEKITIDPAALRLFIDNYRQVYRHYDLVCRGDVFRVAYEELVDNAPATVNQSCRNGMTNGDQKFAELLRFILGRESTSLPKPLKETVKQSTPELLAESITNYQEIVALFGDELLSNY